jgi:ADP-heptose:LPS heptosyltransferase
LPAPELAAPAAQRGWARPYLEERFGGGVRPLAVHPGSGGRRKCWPADRFARLVERMGRPALLIGGPADDEPLSELSAALGPGPTAHLAQGLSLARLAAVLCLCAGYVGNDSGLSHFSAVLGVPTVAVFGPTDPAVWAPLGVAVRVVAGSGEGWPAVESVFEAAEELIGPA